jgi:adenylate kinase
MAGSGEARMRILLMGPPGAGKGTQAERIAGYCKISHIATGDIFREAIRAGTDLGRQAKSYLDAGELVPDAVTVGIVRERAQAPDCKPGFLLDGFPRTIPQAEALERLLEDLSMKLDLVLNIKIAPAVLVERLTGRRICRQCGTSYHLVFNPPKQDGICDRCGGELYQRSDDKLETIGDRMRVYTNKTAPLLEFYRQRGLLRDVDGEPGIDAVWDVILGLLRSLDR